MSDERPDEPGASLDTSLALRPDTSLDVGKRAPLSLVRQIFRWDNWQIGCSSSLLFVPAAMGAFAIWGFDVSEGFLLSLLLSPIAGAVMYRVSAWFQDFCGYAHTRLPGRQGRDMRWLKAWEHDTGHTIEASEARGLRRYRASLWEQVSRYRVDPSDPYHPSHLTESQYAAWEEAEASLLIDPQGGGYCVQLEMHFPPSWKRALLPCVGEEEVPLTVASPGAVMRGDEEQLVRPFVLGSDTSVAWPPSLVDIDDATLWCGIYQDKLRLCAQVQGFWRADTLVVAQWTSAATLESTFADLLSLKETLWALMVQHDKPLFEQLSTELLERVHEFGKWPTEHHLASERGLRWWLFLCSRFSEERGLMPVQQQLFLRISKNHLQLLLAEATSTTRESVLIPALRDFLLVGWVDAMEHGIVMPESYSSMQPPIARMFMDEVRFAVWLPALQHHMLAAEFQALCESIVEGAVSSVSSDDQQLIRTLREEALAHWILLKPDDRNAKLIHWLEVLDMRFKSRVLQAMRKFQVQEPGLEAQLHKWLFVEEVRLSHDEEEVRLATLRLLRDVVGTTLSIQVIQRGLDIWDPEDAKESHLGAQQVLHELRQVPALGGAISTVEEEGEVGQLSLTDDERVEGQLSLEPATDQEEKGRS